LFDSVLTGGNVPKSRFGIGAIISVVIHVALLALVVFLSTRPVEEKKEDAEVKFFAAAPVAPAPPPPPPPPASSKPKTTKTEKKTIKKPDQIVQPKEIPQEKPKEAEPEPEAEAEAEPEEGGQEGGVIGGVAGGVVGGVVGGQVGGTLGGTGPEVLPFGEGMSRPVGDPSNRPPQYTREALEARIEGLMLVKCTITLDGELKNCRVIKPLPHMDKAVLAALSKWKFAPVTFQGRPVAVDYVIPVRLIIPR
jgi:protein TonB